MRNFTRATLAVAVMSVITPAVADQNATAELEAVREEIRALRQAYESRITELEGKLEQLESRPRDTSAEAASAVPAGHGGAHGWSEARGGSRAQHGDRRRGGTP